MSDLAPEAGASSVWQDPAFDDSAWDSGPAVLGYHDIGGAAVVTELEYGPDINNKRITYLFRNTFNLANAASTTS